MIKLVLKRGRKTKTICVNPKKRGARNKRRADVITGRMINEILAEEKGSRLYKKKSRGNHWRWSGTVYKPIRGVPIKKRRFIAGRNPKRRNPDSVEATELKLYIDNDGTLYKQQTTPIQQNLSRKFIRNSYDHTKAVKLWMYLVDNGAKKYAKEFSVSTDWNTIFPRSTRLLVAKELADEWLTEMKAGNFNLPARGKTNKYYVLHKDGSIAGTSGTKKKAVRLLKDLGATDILLNNPKRRNPRNGGRRITKESWYAQGGLSNSKLFRLQKRGIWHYYTL